jgi:hypothetical protein
MQDGFESCLRGTIGENQVAHRGAVQATVRTQHAVAKSGSNRGHGSALRSSQGMRDGIRIDQGRTPLGKEFGDRTLAAADAAGQADNEAHGVGSAF